MASRFAFCSAKYSRVTLTARSNSGTGSRISSALPALTSHASSSGVNTITCDPERSVLFAEVRGHCAQLRFAVHPPSAPPGGRKSVLVSFVRSVLLMLLHGGRAMNDQNKSEGAIESRLHLAIQILR